MQIWDVRLYEVSQNRTRSSRLPGLTTTTRSTGCMWYSGPSNFCSEFSNFSCKGCRSVLSPSQTQPASHQLSGDPMCNKGTGLVLEIFAGSCRLSKACRGISLQALSVDKDLSRAENAVVAKYDLCDENHFQTGELGQGRAASALACALCVQLRYSFQSKGALGPRIA